MPDVFVSYAREDRDAIREIVAMLERQGRSAWWDRDIGVGIDFQLSIEKALAEARCILVVWSANSVDSPWVRAEAQEGLSRRILVPVRLDDAEPPLIFRGVESARLAGFPERTDPIELRRLSTAVDQVLDADEDGGLRDSPIRDDPTISTRVAQRVLQSMAHAKTNLASEDALTELGVERLLSATFEALLDGQREKHELLIELAAGVGTQLQAEWAVCSLAPSAPMLSDPHGLELAAVFAWVADNTPAGEARLWPHTDSGEIGVRLTAAGRAWAIGVRGGGRATLALVAREGARIPSETIRERLASVGRALDARTAGSADVG